MSQGLIPAEIIEQRIFLIRGEKVMLDRDLAYLYGVKTKILNQAVKRNIKRFPRDFMFQLTKKELENWKSQIVTSNQLKMGLRKKPLAFTELGIAMLPSVLNSERAIAANIQVMSTFTKSRKILSSHKELKEKIEEIEKKIIKNKEHSSQQFQSLFTLIKQLPAPPRAAKKIIGFIKG